MNSNKLIIQDYLSSLKEDVELDYLFPLLLSVMGFRIVQTAKESKGQSQYGKDIIAIGSDESGQKHRWYFELKGYSDKDITQKNFFKSDGIRESIIEAKDTYFNDSSIPMLKELPIKIVLVHNGVIKANIRPTFDGFISNEFESGQFERWDIYHLTDLFSDHLFNEHLLLDNRSNRLLKKTLALLDAPDNNYLDFKNLIIIQLEQVNNIKSRAFKKLFATLNLLANLVFLYSKENDYLTSAKECSKILILTTWHWILKQGFERKKGVINAFKKLLSNQQRILDEYFNKTLTVAQLDCGLFSEKGHFYERIGYPIRCFEYIEDLIFFYRLNNFLLDSSLNNELHEKRTQQKEIIIKIIHNNSGFYRPILDNHSIPIMQLFLFFMDERDLRTRDENFIYSYIEVIVESLKIGKLKNKLFPEINNNINAVIETLATQEKNKSDSYNDSSSTLIAMLMELCVVFNSEKLYSEISSFIDVDLSLQIISIDFKKLDVERLLFEKNLDKEYFVECVETRHHSTNFTPTIPSFSLFKTGVKEKETPSPVFISDEIGFSFIRYLAHSYYKNQILPYEWRNHIK